MNNAKYCVSSILVMLKSSTRCKNDKINKIREEIVCDLINKKVCNNYFADNKYGRDWRIVRRNLLSCLDEQYKNYKKIECIKRAGRTYNYDYLLKVTFNNSTIEDNIEYKYGYNSINEHPQFANIPRVSNYFNKSFEDFHYNNYFSSICQFLNEEKPAFEIYKKEVGSNMPSYSNNMKSKYKNFSKSKQNQFRNISKKSIKSFLEETTFNMKEMNKKLLETQKGKKYLLCKGGHFNFELKDSSDYTIDLVNEDNKNPKIVNGNALIFKTSNGKLLNILLRWKNGAGFAFPALQIKNVKPKTKTKLELKKLCGDNNISFNSKMKKSELIDLLKVKNINYYKS